MRPGTLNLALYRGDSYSWAVYVWADAAKTQAVDLTGVTCKAEFRSGPGGTDIVSFTATVDATTVNRINLKLLASAWTGLAITTGRWDLQLTYPDGSVVTLLGGTVTVTGDITDSVIMPSARLGARL